MNLNTTHEKLRHENLLAYAEEWGLLFERWGLPRTAGRIWGWLHVCEPPQQTAAQLVDALGVSKGSICWADGMLYLYSEKDGTAGLATCSPDGLEMKGTFSVQGSQQSWAHPVVAGGRLYLRYDDNLYCFDVRPK